MDHLKELGHASIHYVAVHGSDETPVRGNLLKGLAEQAGLSFSIGNIWSKTLGRETEVSSYIDLCRINYAAQLDSDHPPTAIICRNDLVAIGVQAALQDVGLRVPADVSIIGFDNIYAQSTYPRMTVISHMLEEMGEVACELALSMVGKDKVFKALRGHVAQVPSELIVGKTTAKAR